MPSSLPSASRRALRIRRRSKRLANSCACCGQVGRVADVRRQVAELARERTPAAIAWPCARACLSVAEDGQRCQAGLVLLAVGRPAWRCSDSRRGRRRSRPGGCSRRCRGPSTGTSDSVNSAWPIGPLFSARAASPTALRYCGTPNLPASPRPITSTRGAVTPGRSCSRAVLPVLPLTSPRSSRARQAAAAGRRRGPAPPASGVLSAKAPTTMQSVCADAGASWFRLNSRAIEQIPGRSKGRVPYNRAAA